MRVNNTRSITKLLVWRQGRRVHCVHHTRPKTVRGAHPTLIMKKQISVILTLFVILTVSAIAQEPLADTASLRAHVVYLSNIEPARNINNIESLIEAVRYIENQFQMHSNRIVRQDYNVIEGPVSRRVHSVHHIRPQNGARSAPYDDYVKL